MWIEEEMNNKGKKQFRFREYYIDKLTGKKRTVSVTYARNNKNIQQKALIELNELIEEKQRTSATDMTFGELADEWLQDYKGTVKAGTYKSRVDNVNNFPQRLKDTLLKELDYAQFNRFLRQLKRDGRAESTVNNYYSALRMILSYGLEYGDIKNRDLLELIKMPSFSKFEEEDFSFLEQEELDSVIQQLRDLNYEEVARMCLLQTYTGTRNGELVSIDYENNIDWKNKTILIDRTYVQSSGTFNLPKNNIIRSIPFNAETERLLKEQIRYTQLKTLEKGLSKDPILFKNSKGKPITIPTTRYAINKVRIPNKNITTHIFRHTFIARAMEQGIPLHLIAEHVGNTSATIESHYKHFTKGMKQQLKNEIGKMSFGS